MITLDQLKWTTENDRSVEEYLKKIDSGEIKTIVVKNIKDLVSQ